MVPLLCLLIKSRPLRNALKSFIHLGEARSRGLGWSPSSFNRKEGLKSNIRVWWSSFTRHQVAQILRAGEGLKIR